MKRADALKRSKILITSKKLQIKRKKFKSPVSRIKIHQYPGEIFIDLKDAAIGGGWVRIERLSLYYLL